MASNSLVTTLINGLNDVRRDVIKEVISELESNEMVTSEIKELLLAMIANVKPNKKVSKPKQKRYSGYHIFMREYRVVVKAEQPDLTPQEMTSFVAKSWKEVSDEDKAEYNARAAKMKADSENESDGSESGDVANAVKKADSESETDGAESDNVAKKAVKPAKKAVKKAVKEPVKEPVKEDTQADIDELQALQEEFDIEEDHRRELAYEEENYPM
jgi:hypothetical protein